MGKLTIINWAIFNSYVKLPEGNTNQTSSTGNIGGSSRSSNNNTCDNQIRPSGYDIYSSPWKDPPCY